MTCDATIEDSRGQQRVCQLDTGHYPAIRHKSVLRDGKEVMEWTDQAEFATPSSDSAATILSPADTLATAAKLLRSTAAPTVPDVIALRDVPWHAEECDRDRCPCIVAQGAQHPADYVQPGRYIADAETPELAAWIALMHPGVGLALADWLEQTAKAHEASIIAASRVWPGDEAAQAKWIGEQTDQHALAVARQLLGEAS